MDTDIPVKILLWFDFWGVQDSGLDGLWIWLVNKKCNFTYQLLPALQEYSLNLFLNALLTHCHGIFCVTFTVQGKLLSKVHVELSEDVKIYMKVSKKCVWLYGGKTLLSFFPNPDGNTSNNRASLLWEKKTFWSQCIQILSLSPINAWTRHSNYKMPQ